MTQPDVRVRMSAEGYAELIQIFKSLQAESNKVAKQPSQGFSGLNKILGSTTKLLGAVGIGFSALSAVRFALQGVRDLKQWESAWAEVKTVITGTRGEIAATERRVLALGSIVPKDQGLLAKGYYQALSSGISNTNDALAFTRTAAKAATGGLTDVFTAVDVGTTILNAYGMGLDQTDRIFDVLFTTVREGKAEFGPLAQSMGTAIPFFAQAKIPIEQLAAAIATLTKGGLSAEIATTALRSVITQLLKPADEARQTAADLGIDFNVQAVAAKGLVPWLKEVREKTKGSSEAMAKLFPDVRGLNAVLALAGNQWEEYARILDVTTNQSMGASQEAFDKINETAEAQEQLLRNRLKNAWIELGRGVLEAGKGFTTALGAMLPETFEMQVEGLGRVHRQIARVEGRGRELARIYEEVVRKSDGSAESQHRVQKAMEDLATAFPEVITKFDEYGNAIDINTAKLEEYGTVLRRTLASEARDTFRDRATKAEHLARRIAELSAQYEQLDKVQPSPYALPGFERFRPEGLDTASIPAMVTESKATVLQLIPELQAELAAVNAEMARVLIESGLDAEVIAISELSGAVAAGIKPAGDLATAIANISPELRTLLNTAHLTLGEMAELLREASVAPTPAEEPADKRTETELLEDARRTAAFRAAERGREVALAKLHAQLLTDVERHGLEDGLQSIQETYAARRQIMQDSYEQEIAALEAKRGLLDQESDLNKRAMEQAKIDGQIRELEVKHGGDLAALAREEAAAVRSAAQERLAFERELLEARGRQHEAAMLQIAAEAEERRKALVRGGAGQISAGLQVAQFIQIRVAGADFDEAQRKAELAFDAVGRARQDIQRNVDAGLISEIAGQREIAQLELDRLPNLQALGDALLAAAEATGDPERVLQAQQFVASLSELGTISGRVNELAEALDNLGAGMDTAAVDALAGAFAGIGTETQNARQTLNAFASSFASTVQQMISRLWALYIVEKLTGLFVRSPSPKGTSHEPGPLYAAAGGRIRGPGTGTSDSILARLSNGEGVATARAMSLPGGVQLLDAWNAGRIDPRDLLEITSAFAEGGVVERSYSLTLAPESGRRAAAIGSAERATRERSGSAPRDGRMMIGLEDGLVLRALDSPEGQKVLVKMIRKNRRAVGQIVG